MVHSYKNITVQCKLILDATFGCGLLTVSCLLSCVNLSCLTPKYGHAGMHTKKGEGYTYK